MKIGNLFLKRILGVTSIITAMTIPVFGAPNNCDSCDIKKFSHDELHGLSTQEIRLLRNEIFARKGYIFSDIALTKHFVKKQWYKAVTKDVILNNIEKYNVNLLLDRERFLSRNKERFSNTLYNFLYSIGDSDFDQKYPLIDKALSIEQYRLLIEIILKLGEESYELGGDELGGDELGGDELGGDEWRLSPHNIEVKINGDKMDQLYELKIYGFDICLIKNVYCEDQTEIIDGEFCPEFSEMFHFRFNGEKIIFIEFVVAG